MTCILAKIQDGKVHMLGDKMGSNGHTKSVYPLINKVFKVDDFVIGYTSSFRMGQILQYSWNPPSKMEKDSDDTYLFKHVITSIKIAFDNNCYGKKDKVEFEGGTFLLGWHGRLFEMQNNLSLLEYDKTAAVGCGQYFAQASMNTLTALGAFQDDPEKFLSCALTIAAEGVEGVSKEYNYISV